MKKEDESPAPRKGARGETPRPLGEPLPPAAPLVRACGGGVTPVPIPNTAVKAPRGDDTVFKSTGKQRGANLPLGPPAEKSPGGPLLFSGGNWRLGNVEI